MGRGARSAVLVAILSAFRCNLTIFENRYLSEDCLGRLVSWSGQYGSGQSSG